MSTKTGAAAPRDLQLQKPFEHGPDVTTLQKELLAHNVSPGPVDGVFGPAVDNAVRFFQAEAGLKVDGVVGDKTRAALAATPADLTPVRSNEPNLIRERLVEAEIAAAHLGIHEVGGNNHGPWVKKFLAEVGLPEGYAWCDAFQSYEEHQVAGKRLPIESASVAQTYNLALDLGWVLGHQKAKAYDLKTDPDALDPNPRRGDLGCVNWSNAGPPFGDHIILVVNVEKTGATLTLDTVEGNTGSGSLGSQSDGDGVWLRTRVLPAAQIGFVRIAGTVPLVPA